MPPHTMAAREVTKQPRPTSYEQSYISVRTRCMRGSRAFEGAIEMMLWHMWCAHVVQERPSHLHFKDSAAYSSVFLHRLIAPDIRAQSRSKLIRNAMERGIGQAGCLLAGGGFLKGRNERGPYTTLGEVLRDDGKSHNSDVVASAGLAYHLLYFSRAKVVSCFA